ncbi:MAG: PAS domain S-box protein [candidate division KSB1 bacterium]|nr:PAS domain S-box protein [candidate division KSB1 bacterium]
MERVLVLVEHAENRRLLREWLGERYEVCVEEAAGLPQVPFDLGILDARALDALENEIRERKRQEEPVFLPYLLICSRRDVRLVTRHLWKTVDELVVTPIAKVELAARVEILLRARRLSVELAELAGRMEQILENPMVGVYETDAEGRFLYVNRRVAQMYGAEPAEIVGRLHLLDVVAPEFRELVAQRLASRGAGKEWADLIELELLRKDGSRFSALVAPAGVRDADRTLRGFVGMVVDISERKRLEAELQARYEQQRRLLRLMTGREIRMAELKDVIRALRRQLQEAGLVPLADDPLAGEETEEP